MASHAYVDLDFLSNMRVTAPEAKGTVKTVPPEKVSKPNREEVPVKPPGDNQRFKTLEEAAVKLRKNPAWLRAHSNGSRQPTIARVKMGKGYVFDDKDLDEFLSSCRETATAKRKRK